MAAIPTGPWVPEPETFGERLLWVRVKLGLSREAVAERVDIPASTIATWEKKGSMPRDVSQAEVADRYAKAFNVSRAWLLYGNQLPLMFTPHLSLVPATPLETRQMEFRFNNTIPTVDRRSPRPTPLALLSESA